MSDNETVERVGEHLVEAMARGGPIGKGGPADHAAQGDAVVKSHRPTVERRPPMLRLADVV